MVVVLFAESRDSAAARQRAVPRRVRPARGLREELDKIAGRSGVAPGPLGQRLAAGAGAVPARPRGLASPRRCRCPPMAANCSRPATPVRPTASRGPCRLRDRLLRARAAHVPTATSTACWSCSPAPGCGSARGAATWVDRPGRLLATSPASTSASSTRACSTSSCGPRRRAIPSSSSRSADQPALPLSRLEEMDDRALAGLLEKMKETAPRTRPDEEDDEAERRRTTPRRATNSRTKTEAEADEADAGASAAEERGRRAGPGRPPHDPHPRRGWARRAVVVGRPRPEAEGRMTPEKQPQWERDARPQGPPTRRARRAARRVVPGALGRHAQGLGHLLHPSGARRAHGAAHAAPAGLRPAAGADGKPDLDGAGPHVDAEAARGDPRAQGLRPRLRLRHVPGRGAALPHRRPLPVAASTTAASSRGTGRWSSLSADAAGEGAREDGWRRAAALPAGRRPLRAAPQGRPPPPRRRALHLRRGPRPAGGRAVPSALWIETMDRDLPVLVPRPQGQVRQLRWSAPGSTSSSTTR